MSSRQSPFLTARWKHLAMLNYEVDPRVLAPLVPAGTELDAWEGRHFLSIVGFLFLDTRVLGVPIPFHRDFEEVNLRFYVRRRVGGECRRAVAFVKEIVPRAAIAWTARAVYGENYVVAPMSHRIETADGQAEPHAVSYAWRWRGREHGIEIRTDGAPRDVAAGSDVEFITDHAWGYARRRGGCTTEYRVEHPRWRVSPAISATLHCDVADLYGPQFAEFLQGPPASAFLADGSEVAVFKGVDVPA